jgi:predicted RNase H-like HicB family nuclease
VLWRRMMTTLIKESFPRSLAVTIQLTAVFEKVAEGYIGFIEELPGANTQGDTLEEARANLREAVELVLEANRQVAEESVGGRIVIREPFALAG